jgi:hypothetical protein
MNCQFQDEVEMALAMTRREMVEDPGEIWPRVLAFECGPERKLVWSHIDPRMMADWRSKNVIGTRIVRDCFISKVVVFLSDGFHNSPAPGKTFADYPRSFAEWPKELIHETLLVWVNAQGMGGFNLEHPYTRDEKGRRVFAPEPELCPAKLFSRFSFDLSTATEEEAAIEALLSGVQIQKRA